MPAGEKQSLSDIYDFSPVSFFKHLRKRKKIKLKEFRFRDFVKSAIKTNLEIPNESVDSKE